MKKKTAKPVDYEKEQNWYFTFGFGQAYPNGYVKFHGTFDSAREQMTKRFGPKWAFQYGNEFPAIRDKWGMREVILEKESDS